MPWAVPGMRCGPSIVAMDAPLDRGPRQSASQALSEARMRAGGFNELDRCSEFCKFATRRARDNVSSVNVSQRSGSTAKCGAIRVTRRPQDSGGNSLVHDVKSKSAPSFCRLPAPTGREGLYEQASAWLTESRPAGENSWTVRPRVAAGSAASAQLNAITQPKISGQLRKSEMTGRLSPVQEIWNVLIFEPNRDGGAHVASETR
jgi:hypothetical protein